LPCIRNRDQQGNPEADNNSPQLSPVAGKCQSDLQPPKYHETRRQPSPWKTSLRNRAYIVLPKSKPRKAFLCHLPFFTELSGTRQPTLCFDLVALIQIHLSRHTFSDEPGGSFAGEALLHVRHKGFERWRIHRFNRCHSLELSQRLRRPQVGA
jgi:hypothetical protein